MNEKVIIDDSNEMAYIEITKTPSRHIYRGAINNSNVNSIVCEEKLVAGTLIKFGQLLTFSMILKGFT